MAKVQDPHALPPWLAIARAETGVRRLSAGENNERITEYNALAGLPGYDDKVSWCSSFVNWCMHEAGIVGTGSALAKSWLTWGQALESPLPGCIVVLSRGAPASWTGHVGFFIHSDGESLLLLGGNQDEKVGEKRYPLASLLGYRWPVAPP